jgi:hypothetical protein
MNTQLWKKEDMPKLTDPDYGNKLTMLQLKVIIEDLNKRIINDMKNINSIIDLNKKELSTTDKMEIGNLLKNIPSPSHLLDLK